MDEKEDGDDDDDGVDRRWVARATLRQYPLFDPLQGDNY